MTNNINFDGPLGNCGKDTETSITANSMYASNTVGTVIAVVLGGATSIPLPNNQNLGSFVPNGSNTVFTVPETGRYYITYQINTTIAVVLGAGSRIFKNGTTPIPGSILRPVISVATFTNDVIVNLTTGDTISIQLFASIGLTATLLSAVGSTGAALTIIRVQ